MNAPRTATPYEVPRLSAIAAYRDRSADAHEHGARLRDEGFRAGYEVGLRSGAAEAERVAAEHRRAVDGLATALAAIERAAGALERRDAVSLADVERDAVALAVALATELVGRELAITEQPVVDALRRAMRLTPDRGLPRIRVHPDDEAAIRAELEAGTIRCPDAAEIVADPAVERGGCLVDVDACRIDAQLGPAIERLRAALGCV